MATERPENANNKQAETDVIVLSDSDPESSESSSDESTSSDDEKVVKPVPEHSSIHLKRVAQLTPLLHEKYLSKYPVAEEELAKLTFRDYLSQVSRVYYHHKEIYDKMVVNPQPSTPDNTVEKFPGESLLSAEEKEKIMPPYSAPLPKYISKHLQHLADMIPLLYNIDAVKYKVPEKELARVSFQPLSIYALREYCADMKLYEKQAKSHTADKETNTTSTSMDKEASTHSDDVSPHMKRLADVTSLIFNKYVSNHNMPEEEISKITFQEYLTHIASEYANDKEFYDKKVMSASVSDNAGDVPSASSDKAAPPPVLIQKNIATIPMNDSSTVYGKKVMSSSVSDNSGDVPSASSDKTTPTPMLNQKDIPSTSEMVQETEAVPAKRKPIQLDPKRYYYPSQETLDELVNGNCYESESDFDSDSEPPESPIAPEEDGCYYMSVPGQTARARII